MHYYYYYYYFVVVVGADNDYIVVVVAVGKYDVVLLVVVDHMVNVTGIVIEMAIDLKYENGIGMLTVEDVGAVGSGGIVGPDGMIGYYVEMADEMG